MLRVATKEESDTVNVPPAPPLPIGSFFVSQRLLNMRTDTLTRLKQQFLTPSQYQDTSTTYGKTQRERSTWHIETGRSRPSSRGLNVC